MCRGVITDGTLTADEPIFPTLINEEHDPTADFREIMCGACPVRAQCFSFAVRMGYTGVWGGLNLTERDVRALRRKRVIDLEKMEVTV